MVLSIDPAVLTAAPSSNSPGIVNARRHRLAFEGEQVRANWQRARQFMSYVADHDVEHVLSSYAPGAILEHPLLGVLQGAEIERLWRGYSERCQLIKQVHDIDHAGTSSAEVTWRLNYWDVAQGRRILLKGTTALQFERGLIIHQRDRFDIAAWLAQTHGITGAILGWLPGINHLMRREARRALGLGPGHG
ncbi:MAG: nuclear transport factor 2 family protein [Alphaproteobacteria bacterium]